MPRKTVVFSSALWLGAGLLNLSACTAGGQDDSGAGPPPGPGDAESLTVIVLVLDSLMPDEIGASTPNLQALKADGTFFPESRAVFSAETIPNHVAMMTGVYPDRNGIPTNSFWDRQALPDAPGDENLDNPNELTAKTLFTLIDEQCRRGATPANPDLQTGAVLSKGYLYEIFAGDAADPQENDAGIENLPADDFWDPRSSPLYIDPAAGYTPDEGTIEAVLSRLDSNDFLFVNLGSIDRAAHAFGPVLRQIQIGLTDQYVGQIVQALQDNGRWDNTVLIVASDHGMDFDGATGGLATSPLTHDIALQGMLDDLPGCGLEPMLAIQNGGTDSLYITNLHAGTAAREQTLLAVRSCLADPAGATCQAVIAGPCAGNLSLPTNGSGIAQAWYVQANSLDPAGNLPASIRSGHENLGDLVAVAADGYNFSEPLLSDNPIPGNHGHLVTLRNTMLISGGAGFIQRGVEVSPSVENPDPLDRLPEQSENVDVAPTVAWLLGMDVAQFDGRVLSEAFQISASPSSCGRLR